MSMKRIFFSVTRGKLILKYFRIYKENYPDDDDNEIKIRLVELRGMVSYIQVLC